VIGYFTTTVTVVLIGVAVLCLFAAVRNRRR
jgi:hypothetical protein